MMENNQNLTAAQKELLRWHWKLGHIDFRRVQRLLKTGALGSSPLIKAAANVDLSKFPMLCGSCQFGKAKRKSHRPKREKSGSSIAAQEKILSKEVLIPGQKVSMDHFIVSTPGRLFSSRGRETTDRMFKGGVIFVDHASGFVWVEPVVNFTAGEALRAKRAFEREMASMGVTVINYHADNGVFTASEFQDELVQKQQGLTLSGVGAHHQNAMAERAIGTVVSMARTMMLHAKLRWPKAVSTKLWPMSLKHAQHLMNHVPNINNVCALDLVLQTTLPHMHCGTFMSGDVQLVCCNHNFKMVATFQSLIPNPEGFCTWVGLLFMHPLFLWCSTLGQDMCPLSSMLCLMIGFPLSIQMRCLLKMMCKASSGLTSSKDPGSSPCLMKVTLLNLMTNG